MTTDVLSPAAGASAVSGRTARHAPTGRLLLAELRWVFRRPRTLIGLGLFALFPIVIGIGMTLADNSMRSGNTDNAGPGGGSGGGPGLITSLGGNALSLPVIAMTFALNLLLPLAATVAASDAIAGEVSSGTLRGLLLSPIGRSRLLAVKAFGVLAVIVSAAVLLSVVAIATGLVLNGTSGMVTLSGTTPTFGGTLGRVGLAALYVIVQMAAVAAIALAVSATTEHPLVVMAATIGGLIVCQVLGVIPSLDWLQPFLITTSFPAIMDVLRDPLVTNNLVTGALRALCYLVIGYSLALARITTRES